MAYASTVVERTMKVQEVMLQAMSGNGNPLRLREVVHVRLLERQNTVHASSIVGD